MKKIIPFIVVFMLLISILFGVLRFLYMKQVKIRKSGEFFTLSEPTVYKNFLNDKLECYPIRDLQNNYCRKCMPYGRLCVLIK
jgi:hypothetical protein